jgi:hypothetical protein
MRPVLLPHRAEVYRGSDGDMSLVIHGRCSGQGRHPDMSVWAALVAIASAGLVGGLLNAFFADEGFVLWRTEQMKDGRRIIRPGFVGNMMWVP